jgi:hypothetical protein
MTGRTGGTALALLIATMTGCAAEVHDTFGPENQLSVTIQSDSFRISAIELSNHYVTQVYQWSNAGTTASVHHRSFLPHGDSKLEIRDAAGTVVYSRPFLYNDEGVTDAGTAGTWTITVALYGVTGRIDATVQTAP